MESIEEQVISIVAEQLGVAKEQVTPDASIVNDLGADSLDQVELVMGLEEKFDIQVPDDAADKFQTVGQVIDYIKKAQAGASAGESRLPSARESRLPSKHQT